MGICNKVGGIVAPFILGALILVDADQLKRDLATLEGEARTRLLDERLYGGRLATVEDYQACRAVHDEVQRLLCAPA